MHSAVIYVCCTVCPQEAHGLGRNICLPPQYCTMPNPFPCILQVLGSCSWIKQKSLQWKRCLEDLTLLWKKIKKTSTWTSPFLPSGWYFIGFTLDRKKSWGGPIIYTGKNVELYSLKTEGRRDVWTVVRKSSAQFQAPSKDQPRHRLSHTRKRKPIIKSTRQHAKRNDRRGINGWAFSLMSREKQWHFRRVPTYPPSVVLPPPSPFPFPFLSNLGTVPDKFTVECCFLVVVFFL